MPDIYLSSTTGKTVSAQLYNAATAVGTPIALTEIATTGEYFCNLPTGTPAAKYLVVFYANSIKLASGLLDWTGSQEATLGSIHASVCVTLEAEGGKIDQALKAARAARLQTL